MKYEYRWQCAICANKKLKATYIADSIDEIRKCMQKHYRWILLFPGAYDNMIQRRPKGTTRWQKMTPYGWR